MTETTSRHGLPLLASGQAQKEITHNEALQLLDALLHPVVESRTESHPPATPATGQMWIVALSPTDAWTDRTGDLAVWTGGGWRFLQPRLGMVLWSVAEAVFIRFDGNSWQASSWPMTSVSIEGLQVLGPRQAAIADPAGGTTTDTPSRAAISAILAAMRNHGLIAS